MRICRVCLSPEEDQIFQPIMQDDCKTAIELFYVCGIIVSKFICGNLAKINANQRKFKQSIVIQHNFNFR